MKIWAHRGCCTQYPENTLTAFAAACRYDIAGIELDIQLTADGELVVIHDEKVDRTTNGTGMVKDFTLAELQKLEIAAPDGQVEHIPTMAAVFDLLAPVCRERGLYINIELKNSIVPYPGMEEKILSLVAEKGLAPYIIYSSFNPDSIVRIKQLDPTVQTGILASRLMDCCRLEAPTNADALHCNVRALDADAPRSWTQAPIRAWNGSEPFYPNTTPSEPFDVAVLEAQGVTDIIVNQPELYCTLYQKSSSVRQSLMLHYATAVDPRNGLYDDGRHPNVLCTLLVYHATAGSTLQLLDPRYAFSVALYTGERPARYMYEYCYDRDSAWVTYEHFDDAAYSQQTYTFTKDCFFRVCVRRLDGRAILPCEALRGDGILLFRTFAESAPVHPELFAEEVSYTCGSVEQMGQGCLKLGLVADSHYVTNGTWPDTVSNLRAVNAGCDLDGIVHLGDLTDGILPAEESSFQVRGCLQDLCSLGKPVLVVPGNHDSVYFTKTKLNYTTPLTAPEEQALLYDGVLPDDVVRGPGAFWYYRDLSSHKLRILVLFSHDYTAEPRYGFPDEEIQWVRRTLEATPEGWRVLVFSHCPPLPELHYWSKDIRNGAQLIDLLREYRSGKPCKVMALIHGHNHCDQIDTAHGVPIISIGCAKVEYFTDKKPDGATVYPRAIGDVTQELWDVLLVDTHKDMLTLIRFGAGRDRVVSC